ncbi:uncharacterized protein LOC115226285 isoform X2 [Octopus sinensis]|nr:uncharacterized protein LOC115226285 isoform X2 [Octopus sinensis]
MDYFAVILVVAVVVSGGQAGTIKRNHGNQEQICATTCLGTRKFNYEVGSSYEYDYKAQTTTKMNGASHGGASFSLNARVVFEPVTKCDMVMTLNNVQVTNMDYAPEGQQFSDALMKQGLRFSFQDGKIEEVCPMSEESTWVLNIKRGILSAFQNSMDDLDRDVNVTETDVVGKCLTEYKVQDTYRRTKTIHKSKDLLSCSDREYYRIAMNSVKYNVHSKVRSMPLMKSYHNCVQTLDMHDNILTKSECTEENIFRPFSNGKSGAMTEQTQKLTFREKSSSNYRQTERFSHRSDLLFDHKETMYSDQLPTQEILSVFEELCDKMSEDIRPELPKMLNNLIDLMKSVDYATLRRIYSDISREGFCRKNSDRTKRYFRDSLPMLGTVASVKMFQYLTSINQFEDEDIVIFLAVLSVTQNPSKEMVEAVTPLLDNKKISHKVMLSISSMAASYCNKNPKCAEDFEIGALIQKYMSFVGDCDKDANPHVIQALRSLGNIGFSSKAERTLSKCVTTTSFPMEVRVSAIDAFRRIPCDARRSALMEVFVNTEEDSELRINAYLGLMKCPSRMLLRQIHEMLVIGNSNQVGSFIWSHLKNLRQTSDPHLQHIRSFLESEGVVKQFNLDKRKFSRNYGGSFFSKDMNAGAKLDSNVIFSPKSFIPRSANLNLTLDLFGHAINILEVGGRLEGFERDMEHMWSSHRMTNAEPYRNGKSHMYLRFFGNEIFYGDTRRSFLFFRWPYFLTLFKTMQIVNSQVKYPTAIGFPLEMNVKATAAINNNDQTKWKQNGLDLAIKFSAVIEVTGDMTVDAHLTRMGLKMVNMAHTSTGVEFRSDYKEITVKFPKDIIEYANIKTDFYTVTGENEIKLELITDNVQKSKVCTDKSVEHLLGLKFCQEIRYTNASQLKDAPYFPFTGPAHYSYYMENVDVPKGYNLTILQDYPNHTVQFETEGSNSPRRLIVTGAKNRCTFYAETPWRNMKFRAYITGKSRNLTSRVTLNLDKRLEYNFDHNWLVEYFPQGFKWTNNLRAKGPEHSGELKSSLEVTAGERVDVEASATSSKFKPIVASLNLRNDKKSIDATGMFKNGPGEYTLSLNISKEVKHNAHHFQPKLKITALKKLVMDVDSQLVVSQKGKISLVFKLYKMKMKPFVISKPVLLNVAMSRSNRGRQGGFDGKIGYKSGIGNARMVFKLGRLSRVVLLYNFGSRHNDHIVVSSKGQEQRLKNSVTYIYSIDVTSKKRPVLNFNVKGRTVKGIGKLSTSFVAVYTNPSSREKRGNNLKFNTLLTYASAGVTRKYDYILSVVDSKKDINFQVKSKHSHIHSWPPKKIENNFMIQVSPRSVIKTEMYVSNIMTKGRRNSIAKLSYDYNGERMELNEELNQISGNAYKNKIYVQWATGRMVTLKTSLKNNPKVMFVENTLGLPNQREAKLTTTVNKAHRDYGATIEFHADKEIIPTKEDIDWKAVSTIKYNIKRYEASMDTTLLLEWASDKRIRAAVSFDGADRGKSTAKISITTPFKVIQSYSESLEYEVSNRKYTYSANTKWKSYNKENKWTEKLILNYDNNEYYYKYRQDYGNKITEVETSWNFKDYQKSMIFLLKYDNRPFIDMKVTHSKDRQQMNLDSSFAFDMFDKGGKFTTAFHSDYRETTLSGDFEHEYPNYYNERVQVGGSYKMKHNNDVSSVLLQYTNVNSQKSKISVELNKDLPRNLKGKVYILHDDRQLLKMDADYTRTNDNFDMNVDLTGSNSKKMTASANVNLSGRRKTSHAEIRTDSMDVSVDGAIEYHTDHMDGEIRIGSGGKDLLLSGNYKRDSPNHKVSVNLGLPNSKHIKAIATFKDGAQKTLSFNVDSPDFPSLTKIQTDISYLSDYKGITISSSGAVMPYLEKSHFHLYLPKTLLYGSWTDPRNDFSLELSLKSTPRFNSDFLFHYDHMSKVQWEMSVADFNGELLLSSDKSLLKGKFQNAVDLSISYQPREIDAKLNLKTRRAKVNIEIEPKKNNYKADLTFMHKRKEVSIGGSYEVAGRKQIIKANLKTPSFEENLFITVSGKQRKFKVMAKLQQNNIALELSASNNGKSVDMNLFFPKGKARLNFEGELQRFKAFTSVTIDNKEYKFDLSNQNNLEGVLAEITTPQFGTTELRFDFNAEKPRLKASITLPNQHYGITAYPNRNGFITEFDLHFDRVQKHKQLKLMMSYVNVDDRRTFFRQMSVKLSDEYTTYTANLHLKATYGLYLVMSEFSWGDREDQKVGAELQIKHSDKKEVLLILTTPRRNSKVAASLEYRQNQHTAMFTVVPDTSKGNEKFELVAFISGGHNRMHMDMTIRLPKHRNDWRIKSTFSGLDRNTLFRWKTEFSFDEDRSNTVNFELTSYFIKGNNTLEFAVTHPYSNLDLKLAAFTSESPGINLVGMRMNYQSNRYAKQEYLMWATKDRARREVKLRFEKPDLQMEYTGRLNLQQKFISVELDKERNGKREMILSATGKRYNNEMSMNIAYNTEDPNKKVEFDAKLKDEKFMLQIYRMGTAYWNRGNDFSLTIEKRPMSVVFFSFLWNPSVTTDIKEYITSQMRTFGQKVQDRTERAVEKINQEFVKVMDVLSEDFEPVIEYFGNELIDIKSQAYAYLRKVTESKYYKVARTYARLAWDEFWDLYEVAVKELEKEMEYWQQVVSHWMVKLQVIVDSYIEEAEEIYSIFEQYLIDIGDLIEEYYNLAIDYLSFLQDGINLHIGEFFTIIRDYVYEISESLDNAFYKMSHVFSSDDQSTVYRLLKFPKDAFKELLWALEYWRPSKILISFNNMIFDYLRYKINYIKDSFIQPSLSYMEFDPTKGVFMALIDDRPAKLLKKISEYSSRALWNMILLRDSGFVYTSDWGFFDTYYDIKPSSDVNNWLPPFKAQASFFKDRHVTTFDGYYYNFQGSCGYTLAEVKKNFKVVAKFDEYQKNMTYITITDSQSNVYTIYSDGKVTAAGSVVRLPFNKYYTQIYREGDTYILENKRGYNIRFNPRIELVTLEVSGWFFSRVRGLFGSYNNEQFDDMVPNNMRHRGGLGEFVNSWTEERDCRYRDVAIPHRVKDNFLCSEIFLESLSPFRHCFKQVSSEPFYHMCIVEVDERSPVNTICDVSMYYIDQCSYKNVPVTLPKMCYSGSF